MKVAEKGTWIATSSPAGIFGTAASAWSRALLMVSRAVPTAILRTSNPALTTVMLWNLVVAFASALAARPAMSASTMSAATWFHAEIGVTV